MLYIICKSTTSRPDTPSAEYNRVERVGTSAEYKGVQQLTDRPRRPRPELLRRILSTLLLQSLFPSLQSLLPQLGNLLLDFMTLIRYTRLLIRLWPEIQLPISPKDKKSYMSDILIVKVGMAKVVHCTDGEHHVHPKLTSVGCQMGCDFEYFEVWACHDV
jgi:hypothetical protein